MTKTLIIYNTVSDPLQYVIIDGDYSHLDNIQLNFDYDDSESIDRASQADKLLFDHNGHYLHVFSESTKLIEEKSWDKVAVITSLP